MGDGGVGANHPLAGGAKEDQGGASEASIHFWKKVFKKGGGKKRGEKKGGKKKQPSDKALR